MEMPGRKWTYSDYRYSMNTQEKTPEIFEGSYTAKFWEYDSRIGRRWNMDPKPTTGVSDYACFLNNPVLLTDPFGDKVRFEDAKTFFKVMGKAIRDKSFRKQLWAQHKATRITTQTAVDPRNGETREGQVKHDQVFHYKYNKQEEKSLQTAANDADDEMAERNSNGDHSSKDSYNVRFSDRSEKLTMRGAGHPLENGGPKEKSSKQMYKKGTITIIEAGTYDDNGSTVTFYHGAKPITDSDNQPIGIPIPAIGANGGGSMKSGVTIPFNFKGSAKIRMVVKSNNTNSGGDPGAVLLKINIQR